MKNFINLFFIYIIILALLLFPEFVYAQVVQSNCVITKVGPNAPAPNLPPGCTSNTNNGGGVPTGDQAALLNQIKDFVNQGKITFEQSNDREGMTNGSGKVLRDDGSMIAIDIQILRFYVYMVNQGYSLTVSSMVGHHDKYSSSGYVSRHWDGFAADIDYVNGQSVDSPSSKSTILSFMKTINGLIGGDLAPSQLLCAGNGYIDPEVDSLSMDKGVLAPGFTTKYVGNHTNHVHVGY